MKRSSTSISIVVAIVSVVLLQVGMARTTAFGAGNNAFGFNAPLINGFPGRSAEMTGGGAFNIDSKFVHSGGGFRCLSDILVAPPAFFVGCLTGQGVRWDTVSLITDPQNFTCTGADMTKTLTTTSHTVVLVADFYRQGDGNEESFTARMIVSDSDIAGDIGGIQNVWIQGIGCGPAVVSFNSHD
jgi:hypothetical protein